MRTLPLPTRPPDATWIGKSPFSVATQNGQTVYFHYLVPIDSHDENDRATRMLWVAKFAKNGVRHGPLAEAFGINRTTVRRARDKLIKEGHAAFFQTPRRRGPSLFVGEMAEKANQLLATGMSGNAVARELGVSPATLSDNRRKGLIGNGRPASTEPQAEPENIKAVTEAETEAENTETVAETEDTAAAVPAAALGRSERDQRDRTAAMGRAARDHAGRVAASVGAMEAAQPSFDEPLSAVACGGVLTALPALLHEGLLNRAGPYLSLPRGYYGLTSILVLLAFMLMARLRNPEALRHQAPGEWGAVLGLDRCPEVKTLRRKIRALAADEQRLRDWQNDLAQGWMTEDKDSVATLSVDGHVKVYAGRKGRLPKHFVSRQKLCLPAVTHYWVNMLGGRPLLCLHKDLDPGMVRALEQDVLPALERIGLPGEEAPNLLSTPQAEPALTLVFDREGWSPALFGRLARRGIAVITWHKGFKEDDWPEEMFRALQVPVHGPGGTRALTLRLAEQQIGLKGRIKLRQIRRLLDNGRQVAFVTTDFQMPMEQAAGALFSRWAQENFFKYMRTEFNLDGLPVHGLVDLDPQARVVNPARRALDRQINRRKSRLGSLRNRAADLLKGMPSDAARAAASTLRGEIKRLDADCEDMTARRRGLPTHLTVAELGEGEMLDALPGRERMFLNIIRMIAYRAETRMMPAVARVQGGKPRPRRSLAELFRSAADIVPDPANGVLRVRILGTASNAGDAAFAGLLEELNGTRTKFPGTDLRLVYELPANGAKPSKNAA